MPGNHKQGKDQWLDAGYRQFATVGPNKLSINQISKIIDASRSSFYHFFGDLDIFIDELLAKHWQICQQFNLTGRERCHTLFPDLYDLLEEYPVALQFNLQLFHHRNFPRYNYLFIRTYAASARAFALDLFADHLGLNPNDPTVYNLWLTIGEAWYSRLNPDDLSSTRLQEHATEIMKSISNFLDSRLYATLHKNH